MMMSSSSLSGSGDVFANENRDQLQDGRTPKSLRQTLESWLYSDKCLKILTVPAAIAHLLYYVGVFIFTNKTEHLTVANSLALYLFTGTCVLALTSTKYSLDGIVGTFLLGIGLLQASALHEALGTRKTSMLVLSIFCHAHGIAVLFVYDRVRQWRRRLTAIVAWLMACGVSAALYHFVSNIIALSKV